MKLGKWIIIVCLWVSFLHLRVSAEVAKRPVWSKSSVNLVKVYKNPQEMYQNLARHITPLRDLANRRTYCSSSNIEYRGKVYTVTNRHCCKPKVNEGILPDGYKAVGDEALKVIHVAQGSDICVLDSYKKRGLRIAKRDIGIYDSVISIGFPRGAPMTVREGRYQYTKKICIEYGGMLTRSDVRCVESLVNTAVIRPGNSGSPMFNEAGEVIGITYAGSDIDSITTTRAQLLQELATARAVYRKGKRSRR